MLLYGIDECDDQHVCFVGFARSEKWQISKWFPKGVCQPTQDHWAIDFSSAKGSSKQLWIITQWPVTTKTGMYWSTCNAFLPLVYSLSTIGRWIYQRMCADNRYVKLMYILHECRTTWQSSQCSQSQYTILSQAYDSHVFSIIRSTQRLHIWLSHGKYEEKVHVLGNQVLIWCVNSKWKHHLIHSAIYSMTWSESRWAKCFDAMVLSIYPLRSWYQRMTCTSGIPRTQST